MGLTSDIELRLITSILQDRLTVICGAGLSISPPSSIALARDVAIRSYEKCQALGLPALPVALRTDLDGLAGHFASEGQLEFFLRKVVDWDTFIGEPNGGHKSIADLLTCRALFSTITTNYDFLVERSAQDKGVSLLGSLDGDAARGTTDHAPYLKIHGCSVIERTKTVWTTSQVTDDPVIADRIRLSSLWLTSELRNRDIVFVGFWSDWKYLNSVIESALTNVRPSSIILVDPASGADLAAKASTLWALLNGSGAKFNHIQTAGSDFLADLRVAYSRLYLRIAINNGNALFAGSGAIAPTPAIITSPSIEDLHDSRCDADGISRAAAPRHKVPLSTQHFGHIHLLLSAAGALASGADYMLHGQRIRIKNGSDRLVNQVQNDCQNEPPVAPAVDITICAGAIDIGAPAGVVRGSPMKTIVRPGSAGEWLDEPSARAKLGI